MDKIYRLPYQKLLGMAKELFCAQGMPERDALMLSDSLVRADMRGVKSHGLVRIPSYVKQIQEGVFSVKTDVEIVCEKGFSTVVDGHGGLGAIISYKAVEITKNKARENGIAVTVVRNSNHYGAAGLWTHLMSEDKDLLSFTTTNSIPIVAAPGGTGRGIGSNPLAFSIPAKKYANMCLDVSMGYMAQGKIWEYKRLNKPLPENAWLGPDGKMTTDPNQFDIDEYIMIPFGNHKGFGLGVIMEMLSSTLAGGRFHTEFSGLTQEMPKTSHCFAAMRIDAFVDPDEYRQNVDRYIEYLHSLPVQDGTDTVFYPGEIEAKHEEESRHLGVPIPEKVIFDMRAVAAESGVGVLDYDEFLL